MITLSLMIFGYLLGSIPFGYLVGKLLKVDVTKVGSGNIGATNVARTLGPQLGAAVFVFDTLKGTFTVLIAMRFISDPLLIMLIGLCAFIGHMYSIFLKFKGGKGAAVGVGIILGVAPDVFFFTALIIAFVMITSRYVSLSSMIGSVSATFLMALLQKPAPYFWVTLLGTLFLIYKHKENIARLIAGTERKIGGKS